MYDGSDWIVPKLLVDGDIIAMGTIKGDRIVAGAELSAPVIHAGTITSSGNPPAFSLTPDGKLTAKNADISGNINAIGGHFSHVTIDNSCDIQGTLRAEHIVGDIVKAAGGTFPVIRNDYVSGTLTVTINDDQSFDRQIIVPPLVFAAGGDAQNMQVASGQITSPTKGASSFSRCHLRVTHNGQEIYNVTVTGNGVGVFSTVLDMPSGRGDAVLQFTVESSHSNGYTPFTSISNLIVMAVRKVAAGISIR
ncbi:host specificity protein J [Salmonella enterica]|nr:host specificity protein J [Salmonella enterica]